MDTWTLVALFFVIPTLLSSVWQISMHLIYFNRPFLQKYIIRILWMVPIYSLNSWLAMIYPGAAVYLDSLRELYEAFVIYCFMKYLMNYLHYEMNLEQTIDLKPGLKYLFPLCFLGYTPPGRVFLHRARHCILQYVVVRIVATAVAFISQVFNIYGEGVYNPFKGVTYPYITAITSASQTVAMYFLVLFYISFRFELSAVKPISKLMCIKVVIFFSFFQALVISFIVEFVLSQRSAENIFPGLTDMLAIGRELQNFLICIEMLFASISHHYAFSHREFVDSPLQDASESCCFAFLRTLDFTEDRRDVSDHLYQTLLKVKRGFKPLRSMPSVTIIENDSGAHEYTPLTVLNNPSRSNRSFKSSYDTLPSRI